MTASFCIINYQRLITDLTYLRWKIKYGPAVEALDIVVRTNDAANACDHKTGKHRMNTAVKWMMAASLIGASGAANAQIETYDFTITPTSGPAAAATGSFSYDCATLGGLCTTGGSDTASGLLSSLSLTFDGVTYDESTANTGTLELAAGGGLTYILFGSSCGTGGCAALKPAVDSWIVDSVSGVSYTASGLRSIYAGDVVITPATTSAPEIDPTSAASGLALLVGGLIVLRGRKQMSTAA